MLHDDGTLHIQNIPQYDAPLLECQDHALASSYHWSLADIDSMPTRTRNLHLQMLARDAEEAKRLQTNPNA